VKRKEKEESEAERTKKTKKRKRPPIHILATPLYRSSGVWVLKIIIIRGSSYPTSIRRCRQTSQTSRPRIQFCHVRRCNVRRDVFDERCHSSESPRPEDTPPSTSTASLSHCHDPRW